MELENLIEQQMELGQRIVNAYTKLSKTQTDKRSKGLVTAKRTEFQRFFNELNAQHKVIFSLTNSNERKTMPYFMEKKYDVFSEAVSLAEIKIEEWFSLAEAAESHPQFNNTTILEAFNASQLANRSERVRLPRIQIEPFSGDYHKWLSFKNIFMNLVHSKTDIHTVEKFHYLLSNLSGEAKRIIEHYDITEENYSSAWSTLLGRYDNKRALVQSEIKQLMNINNMTSESATNIKKFSNSINECLNALKNLKIDTKTWDPILIYIFVQKMDAETHRHWENAVKNPNEIPEVSTFLEFLDARFRILENLNEVNNACSSSTAYKLNQPSYKRQQNTQPTNKSYGTNNNQFSGARYQQQSSMYNNSKYPPSQQASSTSTNQYRNPFRQNNQRYEHRTNSFMVNSTPKCTVCDDNHNIFNCATFASYNNQQKKDVINQRKLCTNCLGYHTSQECTCSKTCKHCRLRHHTLLHNIDNIEVGNNLTQIETINATTLNPIEPQTTNVLSHLATETPSVQITTAPKKHILLATALVRVAARDGSLHNLRCLLDQGSQASFITTAAMQYLRLSGTPITATVAGLGSTTTSKSRAALQVDIKSLYNDFAIPVSALVINKITNFLPSNKITISTANNWTHIKGLQLADPSFAEPSKVDMLLGADIYAYILLDGIKKGIYGAPVAQFTHLGWILSGQIDDTSTNSKANNSSSNASKSTHTTQIETFHNCIEVNRQLKSFWELEEIPETRSFTQQEKECESIFYNTYKRDRTGRFVVALPFKKERQQLGQSKLRALTRLKQLHNKFNRNNSFYEKYADVLNEYETLEHMKRITHFRASEEGYYIPHHAVIKESSTTTKLRVVFDASAKTTSGESLNEQLLVGPTIQQDLASILMRWRIHSTVLSADITQMYRQVRVREEDTKYQKILWGNKINNIQEYELKTLTFGTAPAAYLAVKCLQELATDGSEAAQIIQNDFYVDDLLTGADTPEKAIEIYESTSRLLEKGGFTLRKWISNSAMVLQNIPVNAREVTLPLSIDKDDTKKTLGMHYHPATDNFQFKVQQIPQKKHTKRTLLSDTAKLFDPLGLVAPVTIKAKIFLQRLWQLKYDWDQPLVGSLSDDWHKFRVELNQIEDIEVTRWLGYNGNEQIIQLHGFCDASEQAYAAVVYARFKNKDGSTKTTLVTSKTRVAPLKTISLPRLELCGAVLLAKLLTVAKRSLNLKNTITHAWTDSEIVLAWLSGQPTRWKTFVANRIVEILEHTEVEQWRHIASKQNPADCASRGIFPAELGCHSLWWNGPAWLANDDWYPENKNYNFKTEIESKSTTLLTLHVTQNEFKIIERFSSLNKLLRIIATIKRFAFNCKHPAQRKYGPLNTAELLQATKICINITQNEFCKEQQKLKSHQAINATSNILTFNPFLDDDEIIRVGGRIEMANLSYDQRHPILLPSQAHFTTLIINDAHIRSLHGGIQVTIALTRKKYWILKSRSSIKQRIDNCVICHRYRASNTRQIMGSLPKNRITPSRPFSNVGVDYAGPIELRMSRGRGTKVYKGYISLFVCFATKAVHIEAVSELTTQAFLAAFQRYTARRGLPMNIYSDNGTNFVGADRVLRKLIKTSTNQEEIVNATTKNGVKWHFIPARSPHFGGLWEAGIKQMKKHLNHIIKDTKLTYEELATVLSQIESSLNSRPLTPLTEDPSDFSALTPGHFLIGNELLAPPTENLQDAKITSLNRWRMLNKLHQNFWRRWTEDYLTGLQQRHKWKQVEKNIKEGDMVLLKEENQPPNQWKLGRIAKINPGTDGHVRVVSVNTSTGLYDRAITKLVLLPIEPSNELTD